MTNPNDEILSIEKWAKKRRVSVRQAYRWVENKKIIPVERVIKVSGIPADTPKPRKGKSDKLRVSCH